MLSLLLREGFGEPSSLSATVSAWKPGLSSMGAEDGLGWAASTTEGLRAVGTVLAPRQAQIGRAVMACSSELVTSLVAIGR